MEWQTDELSMEEEILTPSYHGTLCRYNGENPDYEIACDECDFYLRQHRIMGQGDSARDFGTSESMKNAGILDVFPFFHPARLGQKIRRSPQFPLCGAALICFPEWKEQFRRPKE